MPELPEVETIKRDLEDKVRGKRVKRVIIKNEKCIKEPASKEFIRKVEGKRFEKIRRRGKFLLIGLDSLDTLVIHLKLTGQLIYSKEGEMIDYTRLIFVFHDRSQLSFADVRGFGSIWLIPDEDFDRIPSLGSLGLEPLEDVFSLERFRDILRKKKRGKIKPLLMDQSLIAGIGNVYSQEALFLAGIHPERNPSELLDEEIRSLYNSLRKVLQEAIRYRGSSVDNYVDLEGKKGSYEQHLNVYGREGQSCPRCGAKIRRITLAGRGTYFCPNCQK